MFSDPPSWRGRGDKKSRGDRILGSIMGLGILLAAVVAVLMFLNGSGGLEGLLGR